ncbi:unnamed protein product [Chironomus riparius]|uniref:Uncharacterized protein n=1 Tax=Chironomus riparius TaxID=315576 RepID=A0A9N9WTQ9_9DIPT|nr:unnamed protein product [Chironomus riparius]
MNFYKRLLSNPSRMRTLRWAGHVFRRPQDPPVLNVTVAVFIDCKTSRGRPKNT